MSEVTTLTPRGRDRQGPAGPDLSRLVEIAQADADGALRLLGTSRDGLHRGEFQKRLEHYGVNKVLHEQAPAWWSQLAGAFINPFIGVLAVLVVVSLLTDVLIAAPPERQWSTVIILLVMITVSALLRFIQEHRSSRAAEQLQAMVGTTATVLRAPLRGRREVPMFMVVPGDIVLLAAGDMVPADVRLLSAKDLFINQSALTGEALPVEKTDSLPAPKAADPGGLPLSGPLELSNLCFAGTNVVSGTATAVVIATGSDTYFGSMARGLLGYRSLTSFDRGVNSVSQLLIRFMLIMVPIVFLVNGLTKGDWLQAFLFGISVAVGLTPEMLPMIVTANLARGAVRMSRSKVIVKRLNAIQNLGAMDILCTDKTGTLTEDRIVLERHLDFHGDECEQVLEYAYLNSFHQTGLKSLLDVAVLRHGELHNLLHVEELYRKVDEIPWDFMRRRMSIILEKDHDRHLLICKGAVEEVLGTCAAVLEHRQVGPFTEEVRKRSRALARRLNEEGMRVVAVAYREFTPEDRPYTAVDESSLVLAGFIAFLDPPKETAGPAIAALQQHGVQVKVLTGDSEIVTRKVCQEVGLPDGPLMLGSDVELLSDEDLAEAAERTVIFAGLAPLQKARVIRALQRRQHTVGYLGDGINDAGALRDADVGISVDTAVDIAKESADIILLEKSLLVLEEGVVEGRRTFGNIIKYIKMAVSSNFGNVFSVLGGSLFLPFLPMLPLQLLTQNLLYDLSQASIPWDHMDEDYLIAPRKWDARGIARFMACIGPISSLFDYATFALLWFGFQANTPAHQGLFQSGWFVEGLLSQTLIVHMIRTRRLPFLQSMAAAPVLLLTILIMALGIYIPYSPFGARIGLVPLPSLYFPWLLGILLAYCVLTQVVKAWFIRRFGQWL